MDLNGTSAPESSVLTGTLPLAEKIARARLELLDLSARNRLINTPRSGKARTVEVVNELAVAMYQALVIDEKRFTFAPARITDPKPESDASTDTEEAPQAGEPLTQPDAELDEQGRVAAQWDGRLSTRMTSAGLQKRLLDLYIDARTLQEEQGVNILYLPIGYLQWRDTTTPDLNRYAPLVLVPVVLERSTAGEKFHLRWSGEDIEANLSLQAFLARNFGLKLPDIDDFEALNIDGYLAGVETMVEGKEHWTVLRNDAVLGLFSFAKFMMYRDLDPEQWKEAGGFESIPTLRGVVSDGFPQRDLIGDDANVDAVVQPVDMLHVLDSDSSQSLVVHDARRGTHLLVQGPPGTGKSQTIANIIAAAVADGKRVLFVAEKMAALEVVKRRLDHVGIGVACLELHSNKANKRAVLEELKRTSQLGSLRHGSDESVIAQLQIARDRLNDHAARLHKRHLPSELTAYEVIAELVRLKRAGYSTSRLKLDHPARWRPPEKAERQSIVQDLSQRIAKMGTPVDHAWSGVGNDALLPNDRDRLADSIGKLSTNLGSWLTFLRSLSTQLGLETPTRFGDVQGLQARAMILVEAPAIGPDAFLSPLWNDSQLTRRIVEALESAQSLSRKVQAFATSDVLSVDWSSAASAFGELPGSFTLGRELDGVVALHSLLERSRADVQRLVQLFDERMPITLDAGQRLVAMAERAESVPELQREALVANVWDRDIESIVEILEAVEKVQHVRKALAPVFGDLAWTTDLSEARNHLATQGGNWLRFLNGNWRRSRRLVKSLLVTPAKRSGEELLRSIDLLLSARASQNFLRIREAQAREAFGLRWDSDRSDVGFLRSVVVWMRELRPLGVEARRRLADLADRELAAELGRRLGPVLKQVRDLLIPINEGCIAAQKSPWGEEILPGRIALAALAEKVAIWKHALDQCGQLTRIPAKTADDLVDRIVLTQRTQKSLESLRSQEQQGRSAFGLLWHGFQSQPMALHHAIEWISAHPALIRLASQSSNPKALLAASEKAVSYVDRFETSIREAFARLRFGGNKAIPGEVSEAPLETLLHQLVRWHEQAEGLKEWVAFTAQANEGRRKGLGQLVDALEQGTVPPESAIAAFDLAYYEAILAEHIAAWPELAKFDGLKHSQHVNEFGDLDRRRIKHSIQQVLKAHREQLPRGGAAGPTGILRAEMERRRKHMPIRQLMQRCHPAIQALKPVFMMSPLSVAQFLSPGVVKFDVLVIDEASQVQPVDALGAIARAEQLVIVGDERQLPPTRFFSRLLDDGRDDDEQGASTADIESILGLCRARGMPERMLLWHYRSRHQSLIAVSNSQFYNNKLFIVPSPYNAEAGMGLRLRHMPENTYDRGEKSINVGEARAVALAVLDHTRMAPQMSLGVATFSTKQRRAIMDELELLRRQHPDSETFFSAHDDEPFFIKNLENVQGDERDVIFISVGYGRDPEGRVAMSFGPLNNEGGERRLNVLISRAKRRCEIFSSITDEDIDLERARGKGVAAFKCFLHYARTGRLSITNAPEDELRNAFADQVAEALKERGYNVHPRIGTAGCFVDLGVADPKLPGRYVLGIDCDGNSYRKARSARDRDRLRSLVLEDQGWFLHRIWISDWFHRPQAELDRLIAAIGKARSEIEARVDKPTTPSRAAPVEVTAVQRAEFVEVGLAPVDESPTADRYEEAAFRTPHVRHDLHELPSGILAGIVQKVVSTEGPVHRAEVIARIRSIWGLQRAGGRIQAAIDAAISHAHENGGVVIADEGFLHLPNGSVKVRDRSEVSSHGLRRPEYLPPQEIDLALRETITENLGATLEELVLCVSRKFGYRNTSAQLREIIEARARRLISEGSFQWQGEHLTVVT